MNSISQPAPIKFANMPSSQGTSLDALLRTVLLIALACIALGLSGCASMLPKVPMASPDRDIEAKKFPQPPKGLSGLYIYRDSIFGGVIIDQILLDGEHLGVLAVNTYKYSKIDPGHHKLFIETEFSGYTLDFDVEEGRNIFIRYYMRMGVFRGNGAFEIVESKAAQDAINSLKLAE